MIYLNKRGDAAADRARASVSEFQKRPYELTVEQIVDIMDRAILSIASTPFVPLADFKKGGTFSTTFEFLQMKGMLDKMVTWEKAIMSDIRRRKEYSGV